MLNVSFQTCRKLNKANYHKEKINNTVHLCNAYVYLFSAPFVEFSKPLHDVEVKEKETAKFECEVSRESAKVFFFFNKNLCGPGPKV